MCVCVCVSERVGGSLPSDNSEGWHLAVCGLNSLTLSTRPLNPCRGREEQGSARRRTNLLSLMLDISLRITVTQRRERERSERERGGEGGLLSFI